MNKKQLAQEALEIIQTNFNQFGLVRINQIFKILSLNVKDSMSVNVEKLKEIAK